MKTTPLLLKSDCKTEIPRQMFSDINLDRLISEASVKILQSPCSKDEILLRQEFFTVLNNGEKYASVEKCLKILIEEERLFKSWNNAETEIEGYFLRKQALKAYVRSEKTLSQMTDCGKLFFDISTYFSAAERRKKVIEIEEDMKKAEDLLRQISKSVISFSGQTVIAPDTDIRSEIDILSETAKKVGFFLPEKKELKPHLPKSISDALVKLYPSQINELKSIFERHNGTEFREHLIYIPQIQFFSEIFELIKKAERNGLQHCFPTVCNERKYIAKEAYDIALLAKNCKNIIPNDIEFTEQEPFCFLIGANGGGKTTYLRTVAINLILFLSGCPIFAKEANIFPFEFAAVHFPKDERFDESGRLDEELKRANEIVKAAENIDSFLFFNETFSGTDEKRGLDLLKEICEKINKNKNFGLYVTHFHQVTELDSPILSAQIDESDENKRTYKIKKSKGSASSYALDILKKYGLDKESLRERIEKK